MPVVSRGFIAGGFDAQDRAYSYLGGPHSKKDLEYVNLWTAHKNWLTPAYNQHSSGSCVANATAALVRYSAHKANDVDTDEALANPSRAFIYYHARALDLMTPGNLPLDWPAVVNDSGCDTRNAMKGLNLVGIAPEKDCPWVMNDEMRPDEDDDYKIKSQEAIVDLNARPSYAAYRAAQNNYTFEYCRLDPDHTEAGEKVLTQQEKNAVGLLTLGRLKQCLVEGYPVVFGFNYYEANPWDTKPDPRDVGSPEANFPSFKPIPPGREHMGPIKDFGAHAVLAIGFKDDVPSPNAPVDPKANPKGRVLCQNSWGDDDPVDEKTHFWLPYEYILDFKATDDFWMLRLFEKNAPKSITRADFKNMKIPTLTLPKDWKLFGLNTSATQANTEVGGSCAFAFSTWQAWTVPTVAVFWINEEASVRGGFWSEHDLLGNTKVSNFSYFADNKPLAPSGQAYKGAITAVSRSPAQTEVWWIGRYGSIQGSYKAEPKDFVSYTLRPDSTAQVDGGLASLSMHSEHMAVWWVGKDGAVRGAGFQDGKWQDGAEVAPAKSANSKSTLTVLKTDKRIDLWWINENGSVWGRVWKDGDWKNIYKVAPEQSAARRSRIAAVSRASGVMDLFFISPSGSVKHWYWMAEKDIWEEDADFTKRFSKFLNPEVEDPNKLPLSIARVDSGIQAVSIMLPRFDVFWVHPNNSICQYRASTSDYSGGTFQLFAPGQAMPGTPLGVMSRKENSMTLIFKSHVGQTVIAECSG